MANPMLDAAVYAAETLGIPVIPLGTRSKEPVTEHGVRDATTDLETITEYYEEHPNRNLGFVMGDGLVAIDVDRDEDYDGYEAIRDWEIEHGELPETLTTITGRGGSHMIYRVDQPIGNCVNEKLHIDIRGDGGYIMAPPSVHPNGRATEWELSPEDGYEIADADENVYAFIEHVAGSALKSRKFKLPKEIKSGERNDTLYRYGCSLRALGHDEGLIRSSLEAANKSLCNPQLSDAEVRKIAESVMEHKSGFSDTVKKRTAKKGGSRSTAGPKKAADTFDHAKFADKMIEEDHVCVVDGALAIYKDGCYRIGKRPVESGMIARKHGIKSRERNEVLKYLEIEAPEKQMADKRYIAFANCVLDIKTLDTFEMSPAWVIPNIIPHRWNPNACDGIVPKTFAKMAMGDVDVLQNLLEVIGYSMYRGSELATCPVLFGTGQNGKSTYLNMLHRILGDANVSSLDVATIGERFQTVPLMGKLANIGDDISNEFVSGTKASMVKKVITGDWIQAEYKGGDTFQFKPYCTLIFSCNEFPRIGDSSEGMMRRLHPIKFAAKFSKADPDYDPYIEEKLATESAIETAIYYGVIALQQCLRNKEMTQTDATREEIENIKMTNSTVYQFAVDDLGLGSENETNIMHVSTSTIFSEYLGYCDELHIKTPVRQPRFSNEMKNIFDCDIRLEYIETAKGRKRVRCFAPRVDQPPEPILA